MGLQKPPVPFDRVIQFGVYEVDLEAGELHRNGRRIRLQEQPFKILASLLAHPGALVTREVLQAELWGSSAFIDADQGLNTAIRKLRTALQDDADNPRFIETVPKRGYRFIGPLRGRISADPAVATQSASSSAKDAIEASFPTEATDSPTSVPAGSAPTMVMSTVKQGQRGSLVWLCVGILAACLCAVLVVHVCIGRATVVYVESARIGGVKHPDVGIGGYDLKSRNDQAFSFDYDHSGKLDHLVLYRPGTGYLWIVRHSGNTFRPVFEGMGIGDYDLKASTDRILAFDYDHSGRQDHLVIYRPGAGVLGIVKNVGDGLFTSVYRGISSDDPAGHADQIFAFDYNHSGRLDHLMVYRPGRGILAVWTNSAGQWSPVRASRMQADDVSMARRAAAERALPFDYDHSGKLDCLLIYQPGDGLVTILKNTSGVFTPVFHARGLGGFDLKSADDQAVAFDYDRSGKLDHLLLYRPGTGFALILKHSGGTFGPVYEGRGLAGYDLMSVNDRAFAFDFNGSGKLDNLLLYRPGPGSARIVGFR